MIVAIYQLRIEPVLRSSGSAQVAVVELLYASNPSDGRGIVFDVNKKENSRDEQAENHRNLLPWLGKAALRDESKKQMISD